MENKENHVKFSVSLGLFDYINPILYGIFSFTVIRNMAQAMQGWVWALFIAGAVLSLIFGLTIPTIKLLVGLGRVKFRMPVNIVFFVNIGIFLSGFALLVTVFRIKLSVFLALILAAALLFLYRKTGKFNTIAVLTGAAGYLFLYASLIALSVRNGCRVPLILYALAILLFVFLCAVGIHANLKDAKGGLLHERI
jgi:hypothetical protein